MAVEIPPVSPAGIPPDVPVPAVKFSTVLFKITLKLEFKKIPITFPPDAAPYKLCMVLFSIDPLFASKSK